MNIRDGEFVVLVGPSGCGKTTTLRMIAGLEDISSGTIYIDGERVNDMAPKDRDVAMVFQSYALYPHMSVFDNIAFSLKLRRFAEPSGEGTVRWQRLPRVEVDRRVRAAAKQLGIEDQLSKKPAQLSGGQPQQRAPPPISRPVAAAPRGRGRSARSRRRETTRNRGSAVEETCTAERRATPTGRPRSRHRSQPEGVPLRRAPEQPRCKASGRDAGGAREIAPDPRKHDGLRDPRPGGGDDPR